MNYPIEGSAPVRKFCPMVMCPDSYMQDPSTCQCVPVAPTLSPEFVQRSVLTRDYFKQLCDTIPQFLIPAACPEYYKRLENNER